MINGVYKGGDDTIWITTDNGLVRHSKGEFRSFSIEDGLASKFTTSVAIGAAGRVVVGTGRGLVRQVSDSPIRFAAVPGVEPSLITRVFYDRGGRLNFSSARGAYRMANERQGRPEQLTMLDPTPGLLVTSAYEDCDGGLWFGTSAGLRKVNGSSIDPYGPPLTGVAINTILLDYDGSIWAGLDGGGIARRRRERKEWEFYSAKQGLSNDFVSVLFEDRERNIWAGTSGGGLNNFYVGKFTAFGAAEGLPGDIVYALLSDRNAAPWAGTNNGLVHSGANGMLTFSPENGLGSRRVQALHASVERQRVGGTPARDRPYPRRQSGQAGVRHGQARRCHRGAGGSCRDSLYGWVRRAGCSVPMGMS